MISPAVRRWPLWSRLRYTAACGLVLAVAGKTDLALAQTPLPRTLFGTPGIIDMPSARMAPDGELSAGAGFFQNTQRYHLNFQVLPWLEASFRYSGLSKFDAAYPVYYDRSFAFKARLWDETAYLPALSVGVSDVVGTGIYGGEYVVATKALGDVDVTAGMGWGRMASDQTIKNPLGILSSKFLEPRSGAAPGATNFSVLFRGPYAGLFGGVNWRTPIEGLTLSAEYSSDRYSEEQRRGNFRSRSPFNFGAHYQIFEKSTLSVSWLQGQSIAAAFSVQMDPLGDPFPQRLGPPVPGFHSRTPDEERAALNQLMGRPAPAGASQASLVDALWNTGAGIQDVTLRGQAVLLQISTGDPAVVCRTAAGILAGQSLGVSTVSVQMGNRVANCQVLYAAPLLLATATTTPTRATASAPGNLVTIDASRGAPGPVNRAEALALIRRHMAEQLLEENGVSLTESEAIVYYANYRYQHEKTAVDRLVRTLSADAPPKIERFRIIAMKYGVPQREYQILRGPAEREMAQTADYGLDAVTHQSRPAPLVNPVLAQNARASYPRFEWSLSPQFRQQLFDPDNPFAVQLVGAAGATLEILPGLSLQGQAEVSLYDNFNVRRPSDSVIPHVRTDFLQYFTKGKNGIGNTEINYQFRLSPTVFATARAGLLENMFAGAGGEILWRPEGQRWALGADLYGLKQRGYDRLFSLRDYTVVTGHMSFYYASPWSNLNFTFRVGRYLAGDYGATFEATRRFQSGVEIGAFFTKTNVSSQQFGEGSFDKGISIRIPLGWVAPLNTQSQFSMDLRPVQRDGGQRMFNDTILYDATRMTSEAEARL